MLNFSPYIKTVHRSLLSRDLMAGIPQSGLLALIVASVFFLYILRMFFMIVPLAVLYFVMRFLTSRDPWMIDMVLDSAQQKEIYLP
jgi:type IV secretory pathway VirB3-like protein